MYGLDTELKSQEGCTYYSILTLSLSAFVAIPIFFSVISKILVTNFKCHSFDCEFLLCSVLSTCVSSHVS